MEHLRSRGIKSLPVTIIDDTDVIIGYYPKKLIPALRLDVSVDLSGKTSWLAEKYGAVMSAAVRANNQFSQEQLDTMVPGGPGACATRWCTFWHSRKSPTSRTRWAA